MSDIRPGKPPLVPQPRREEAIRQPPSVPPASLRDPEHRAWEPAITAVSKEALPECSVNLVGERLEGARPFPVASIIFAVLSMGMAALAIPTRSPHPLILALMPASISVALLLVRRPGFDCVIRAEGLEISDPSVSLSYQDIVGVYAADRDKGRASFSIQIFHATGFVTLPANLNFPAEDVYRFLANQPMGPEQSREVHPTLASFLKIQEGLYGPENVWIFRARGSLRAVRAVRTGVGIGLAMVAAALIWLIIGASHPGLSGWLAAGIGIAIAGLVLAGLFWLVGLAAPTRIKNWREACFVVSPGGCGLVQGPLSGELKWYELRDVTFRGRAAFSWGGDGEAGLVLNVAGASIVVADIYHRPLAYIQEIVRQFWSRDQQSNK